MMVGFRLSHIREDSSLCVASPRLLPAARSHVPCLISPLYPEYLNNSIPCTAFVNDTRMGDEEMEGEQRNWSEPAMARDVHTGPSRYR